MDPKILMRIRLKLRFPRFPGAVSARLIGIFEGQFSFVGDFRIFLFSVDFLVFPFKKKGQIELSFPLFSVFSFSACNSDFFCGISCIIYISFEFSVFC